MSRFAAVLGMCCGMAFGVQPRFVCAAESSASDVNADDDAPPPRVELVLVGQAPGSDALLQRAASWFRDPRVLVTTGHAATLDASAVFAAAAGPGVRIWIWLRTPGAARVFIAAREPAVGSQRYWVSDIALPHGLDEVDSEELAQLVHLSALAVWSGNLESQRSEVEAQLSLNTPAVGPQRGPTRAETAWAQSATLGAEYNLRFSGDEGPAQIAGVVAGLAWRSGAREISAHLHAGVLIPHSAEHAGLGLHLTGGAAALDATTAFRLTKRLWLTGALGPGLDFVHYRAVASADLSAKPSNTDVRPFIQAELGVRAELESVTVSCAGLVAAQLLRVHYDVASDAARTAVITPWLIQPGLAVAVTW